MAKNNGGGRPGLNLRRKNALARLEQQYKEFKAAGKDKESWTSTRNGKPHVHAGKSYEVECKRFERDIALLKAKFHGAQI